MTHFSLQKKLHAAEGSITLDVSCDIEDSAFISLYGPSGAGKTSLLRMLAGFMRPDSGLIKVNDEIWFDSQKKINMIPQRRPVGFVFQDYALFPNMNVEQNILYALGKNDSKKIIDELLEVTGLEGLRDKRIQMLSGGQQQRVALARAIARKPQLLLLDEPLSAIDNEMRSNLQQTLLSVHSEFKVTAIIVSHDINEIVKLTSKTIHLQNGVVQQFQSPSSIFLNKLNEPSSLKGVFLSAEKAGNEYHALILAGEQVITINCSENDANELQKGTEIIVSFKGATAFLRKL
ncbi:MAG TPA: ATP-binding cassette domain-containing protein [Hanamia sp.]|nr:ATP-binding cassette domain-containing protein [Hanamia sp.]